MKLAYTSLLLFSVFLFSCTTTPDMCTEKTHNNCDLLNNEIELMRYIIEIQNDIDVISNRLRPALGNEFVDEKIRKHGTITKQDKDKIQHALKLIELQKISELKALREILSENGTRRASLGADN